MPPALPRILSSLVLAGLLTWLLGWRPLSWPGPISPAHLRLQLVSQSTTQLSVRLDEGHGVEETRASDLSIDLPAGSALHDISIPLPPQRLRALHIAFTSTPAVVIAGAQLQLDDTSPPIDLLPGLQPVGSTFGKRNASGLLFQADPQNAAVQSVPPLPTVTIAWQPKAALTLPAGDEPSPGTTIITLIVLCAVLLFLQLTFDRLHASPSWHRISALCAAINQACHQRPVLTLFGAGLCAAMVSSYPVVFCHKSFVSPNTFPYLLYTGSPTIPDVPKEAAQNTKGSDIAATMVYAVPNSALVHDALFRDHEFPFWNRYVSTGLPLWGQGQTTFGNPLHFLAIAANSAGWAWDLKFLLAKALFAFGIGLCVWQLTRRLGTAALLGASSAWIGFFAYRFNHPAFFSLCFAPWLLVPWLAVAGAASRRALLGAVFGLLAADACELTSGTAKEACMLLVFLNAAGVLYLVWQPRDTTFRLRRLGIMLAASFCFVLLSAPQWLPFFDTLRHGESWYDRPRVYQLPLGLLAGFFDDIFSQDFTPFEVHTHPSINFLVLLGVLWLAAGGVRREHRPSVFALAVTSLPLAALVFGIIPARWIEATPFLGNIYHIHNTFGLPLLILLLLLAGIGLGECCAHTSSPGWSRTYSRMVIALVALLGLYFSYVRAVAPPLLQSATTEPLWHSRFFLVYSAVLTAALLLLPRALRWMKPASPDRLAGLLTIGTCLFVLHFRHGMYVRTRIDDYVIAPRAAADLGTPSPAIERIRNSLSEPWRTAGLDLTFSPDYNALVRLEGISNIDAFSNPWFSALIRAAHIPNSTGARIVLPEPALPVLKPVLDFFNLRYYLREPKPGHAPLASLTPVAVDDLEIYESRGAWPRAFFTDSVAQYRDAAEFVSLLQHGDGRPFAAVQDLQASQTPTSDRRIVPATQYHLTTNCTELTIDAPSAGTVVLTEAFEESNFRASVNGTSVPYFRVNHAFKGVHIPEAGTYHVRFEYHPHLFTGSLWLSAAGALGTALLTVFLIRRPDRFFAV